ncbi:hypothetical protein TSUD_330640 [Trifolium subterraneum]|nr:hypothetical protein TSUD_330640 [Trifolium subterraneum]
MAKTLHTDPSSIFNLLKSYALSPNNILKAKQLFNQIQNPTLSHWNIMIRGWSQTQQPIQAIYTYNIMYSKGFIGNNHTYPFLIKACSRIPYGENTTRMVHSLLGEWNVADAMVEYIEENEVEVDVKPDEITVASTLSACAHIGSLDVGEAVHDYIRKYDVKADAEF